MLSDRWGHKPVLVVGAILFGGGPLLYGLAHPVFSFIPAVSGGMAWLLGARAVHGVGMALFTTAYQAFIADLVPPDPPSPPRKRGGWGGLALAGLAMAGLAAAGGQWALIGVAVLFGVGYGAARAGLDVSVQGGLESSLRASGAAIQYTAHDLLIGLGSWGLGWWAGVAGYGAMYGAVSGITLVGLVGWLMAGRFLYQRAPRRPV